MKLVGGEVRSSRSRLLPVRETVHETVPSTNQNQYLSSLNLKSTNIDLFDETLDGSIKTNVEHIITPS